jgi:hypothetical protein
MQNEQSPVLVITDEMIAAGIKVMLFALENDDFADEELVASIFMGMMVVYTGGDILFSDGTENELRFTGFPSEH